MSSPPPPQSLNSKLPLGSAGQPTSGPLSTASISLVRNTLIPPSLSCNNLPSNLPVRAGSASHNRPSLSSPSPPTPIVPSTPLHHATQHSLHTIPLPTTQPPHVYCPRGSLDWQSLSRRLLPGHKFSTNASNLNLTFPVSASAISIEKPSYCVLPLKQLLAKPSIPPQFQRNGDDGESLKSHLHAIYKSSTSIDDHVTRLTIPGRNHDVSALEPVADRTLQLRPPVALPVFPTTCGLRTEGYHYRQMSEGVCKKKHEVGSLSLPVEQTIMQSDRGLNEGQGCEHKGNRISNVSRPRDVLERQPPGSAFYDSRSRPRSSGTGSHRSRSFSTFIKRARFLTSPSPDIHLLPSKPPGSDAPRRSVSLIDMHHMNDWKSSKLQHCSLRSGKHMHTVDTKMCLPPADKRRALPVAAKQSSVTVSSMMPLELERPLMDCTTTSTVLSESPLMTRCQPYCDNISRRRSPTGTPVDASRREQRTGEASTSASPVTMTPTRPPLLPSLSFPSTFGDLLHFSPPSSPHPLMTNDTTAVMTLSSKHTLPSGDSGKSGVPSDAEILNNEARGTSEETNLARPGDTLQQRQQQTHASSEVVKIPVTREEEDLISYSVHGSSLVHSPPAPLPSLLPKPRLPSLSSPALHSQVHQSSSSSHLASPVPQQPSSPLSASPQTMIKSNKLKKARDNPNRGEFSHSSCHPVVGTRGDQVFGVSDRNDSVEGRSSISEETNQATITIDTAAINSKDKNKMSVCRSLSRKLSEKFIKEKSSSDTTTNKRRTNTWTDIPTPLGSHGSRSANTNSPTGDLDIQNRSSRSLYSMKKQAQSEVDLTTRKKEMEDEKERGAEKYNGECRMFPKVRRLFGGRSKSREMNEIQSEHTTEKSPPLPALPKHHMNDIYTSVYSKQEDKTSSLTTISYKSHHLPSAKSISTGRPSMVASPLRNRSHSAGSLITMLKEAPPMPSPHPDLRPYTIDETDPPSRSRICMDKDKDTIWTPSPQTAHASTEEGLCHLNHVDTSGSFDVERSNSPPIPLFSTAEPINLFPLKRSSRISMTKLTSSIGSFAPHVNPLLSSSSRPMQSLRQPQLVHSRTNSFSDETLYPPVIKNKDSSFRNVQKMTFREINNSDFQNKGWALTEQEKADRWDALLKKSEAAGGTLHFGGEDDKLPSDELRFSKTLSELARDDGSVDIL